MSAWPVAELQTVADLTGGHAFKSAEYSEGGMFILRTLNISDYCSIDQENAKFIPLELVDQYKRFALRPNDTLFVMVGATLGKVGFVRKKNLPALLNQNMWRIRAKKDRIDPIFLHYCFRHFCKGPLEWMSGSARGFVRRDDYRKLEVPLPSLGEQREIAGILGALDDKIELNRRTAAVLEEMARALYRSWFVDFDPVRARSEGRPPAHMSPATAALFPDSVGEDGLPDGWSAEPFLDQAVWVNGAAYKNMHFSTDPDALPVIKIAELKAGVTGSTKFTATDLGDRYRISRGELLFSWSGNPDTSIDAFVWPLSDAWLNQHIFAVRNNGRMSRAALFCALRYFKPEMAEIARNKQTTGLGHITRKDLEGFPVTVAPEPIETAFEAQVTPLFERYCACLYESQTLTTLRDILLPKLMSGQVKVGEASESAEALA